MSSDSYKIFVGGLNPRTTREVLIQFFSKYGELLDCRMPMKDYMNESKGFAFITFKDVGAMQAAVTDNPLMIDGRCVETRMAGPRAPQKMGVSAERSNRVFVGGVRDVHSREVLSEFFNEFGAVTSVECFSDKITGKCRGFAFVVFESCDTAEKLIEQRLFIINGHQCEVKAANRLSQRNQSDRDRECRSQRQRFDPYGSRQNQDCVFESGCIAEKSGSRTSREEESIPQSYVPPAWGGGAMWPPQFSMPNVYSPTMMQSYAPCLLPFPDVTGPPPGYWIEGEQANGYVPHIMQEFLEDTHYEPYYAS